MTTSHVTDLAPVDEYASSCGFELLGYAEAGVGLRLYTDIEGTLHFAYEDSVGYLPQADGAYVDFHAAADHVVKLHAALAAVEAAGATPGGLLREIVGRSNVGDAVAAVTFDDYAGYRFDRNPAYGGEPTMRQLDHGSATDDRTDHVDAYESYLHIPTGVEVYRVHGYCACCGPDSVYQLDDYRRLDTPEAATAFADAARRIDAARLS